MKNKTDITKIPFTGIGLIFGTAIGYIITTIISIDIFWSGIGTAIGLIIGAVVESFVKRRKSPKTF